MTDWQTLEIHRDGAVAELRLSRPELLNRFDLTLHGELIEALDELAAAPDVRAVLLASTGRVFSAGGDTTVMLEASGDMGRRLELIDQGRRLFRTVADFPKPIVVALEGSSYGLATSIVLACDAVVTTPDVELSDPHVAMALTAGDGGVVAWPSSVGAMRAKRHLLTGDPLTGAVAFQLGAVTDLVDDRADVRSTAMALAQRIAGLPPLAVQLTKRALNKVLLARADEALDTGFYLEALTFGSEDLLEAVDAFKAKRPGVWKGR